MGVKQVFLMLLLCLAGCFLFFLGVVTGSGKKLVLDVRLESAVDGPAKLSANADVGTPPSAKANAQSVESTIPLAASASVQPSIAERALTKQPEPPPSLGASDSGVQTHTEEEPPPEEKAPTTTPEPTSAPEEATVTDPPPAQGEAPIPTDTPTPSPTSDQDNVAIVPQQFEAFVPTKFVKGNNCKYHIRDGGPQTAQAGTPCIPSAESWPYKTSTTWRQDLGERVLNVLKSTLDETTCGGFRYYERFVWCDKAFENKVSTGLSFATGASDTWCEQIQVEYSISASFHSCMPKPEEDGESTVYSSMTVKNDCLGLEAQEGDPPYKTLDSFLTGLAPLSVHLRIDTEITGWLTLERLLKEGAPLQQKIRSLDLEVSLGSRAPFETELENLGARVLMDRHIRILESLLIEFKCVGSNVEALRQGWRPSVDCPDHRCEEPDVHTKGGFSPRRFAVSFVNRQLLTGEATAAVTDGSSQEASAP